MRIDKHILLPFLCATITSSFCLLANAQQSVAATPKWDPCSAPVEVASRTYKHIQQTQSKALQHELKAAFWNVHDFAKHCPEIVQLAERLVRAKLARSDSPPTDTLEILSGGASFKLPSACLNGGCSMFVTKPGTGNSQGMQGAGSLYLFELPKAGGTKFDGLPLSNWRELEVDAASKWKESFILKNSKK